MKIIIAYHGTSTIHESTLKTPLFVSTQKDAVEYFAQESQGPGIIYEGNLQVKTPFEALGKIAYDEMLEVAKKAGIEFVTEPYFQCDEIKKHSPYDGSNSNDLAYVPQFVEMLKSLGFDSIHVSDVLCNTEIDTYILFDAKQFKILKHHPLKNQQKLKV